MRAAADPAAAHELALRLTRRAVAAVVERNIAAEGGADGPAGKREVRAAEHGRIHAAGIRAELPREVGCERGRIELAPLDELHQLRARQRHDLGAAGALVHERDELLLAQRQRRGQHEHAPVVRHGGLERRLDADDGDVRKGGAQRADGRARGRVAGDDGGLDAAVIQPADDILRQAADLRDRAHAVGGVGRVAEIEKVLPRQALHERAQDTDAAEAGIKHRDRKLRPLHGTPSFPNFVQNASIVPHSAQFSSQAMARRRARPCTVGA